MIRGGVAAALDRDSAVACVVVGPVALVQALMFGGPLFVAELMVDQREIVMRRQIFGIKLQRLFELFGGLRKKLLLRRFVAALEFGAFKKRLAEFIDDFVIFAEIEISLVQFRIAVFENAAKFGNGFV